MLFEWLFNVLKLHRRFADSRQTRATQPLHDQTKSRQQEVAVLASASDLAARVGVG
jgi:hypothetical protein